LAAAGHWRQIRVQAIVARQLATNVLYPGGDLDILRRCVPDGSLST